MTHRNSGELLLLRRRRDHHAEFVNVNLLAYALLH